MPHARRGLMETRQPSPGVGAPVELGYTGAMRRETAESKALTTAGTSETALYELVRRSVRKADHGGILLDVGCGRGNLWRHASADFQSYVGIDVVRYPELPVEARFLKADLNGDLCRLPIEEGGADVAVALGLVEYLDNPRGLVRELARAVRPGGLVVVSTPNHASFAGRLAFALRGRIQTVHTPRNPYAITTLLAADLVRAAKDAGLGGVEVFYTDGGRIPGTSWRWPRFLRGQLWSDGVLVVGRKG